MQASQAHRIADAASRLHRMHPQVPAIDLLDQLLGVRKQEAIEFPAELVAPPTRFGQLIAEAFDTEMTPAEWIAWAGDNADLALRNALLGAWFDEVLPRFTSRYGLPKI